MSKFWDLFDKTMDALPGEIDNHFKSFESTSSKKSFFGSKTVVKKKTVNGKVVEDYVMVDGVKYVPEKPRKDKV